MNRRKRRLVRAAAFFLMLGLCVSLLGSAPVLADGGSCGANGDDVRWETLSINGGSQRRLIISGTGRMKDYTMASAVPWRDWRDQLVEVEVQEGVTYLGAFAFNSLSKLTSLSLPDSLTGAGLHVLGANRLTDITIPANLTGLTGTFFNDCDWLEAIQVADGHPDCCAVDGVLYSKDLTRLIAYPNARYAGVFAVPDTVTEIGEYAFSAPSGIFTLALPEGVVTLGKHAVGCSAIDRIYLPASLTAMTDRSVSGGMLKDIYYNGQEAALQAVYATDSSYRSYYGGDLTNKIRWSFGYDPAVAVHYDSPYLAESVPAPEAGLINQRKCGDSTLCKIYENGALVVSGSGAMKNDWEQSPLGRFAGTVKNAVIEEGVTSLCQYFFAGCDRLTEVSLPESLEGIDSHAFYLTPLESIALPDSLGYLSSYAFCGCDRLRGIALPEGLTSVGIYAFSGCDSLAEVTLPDSLRYLGSDAFALCTSLEELRIPEGMTQIDSDVFTGSGIKRIYLPSTLETVRSYAFLNCDSFTDIYTARTEDWWLETEIQDPANTNIHFARAAVHYGRDDGLEIVGEGDCSGEGGSVAWVLNKRGNLTISGEGKMTEFDSYGDVPWYGLSADPKRVVIGDGVENVGAYSCQGMKSVQLGESVASIGSCAFSSGKMTELTIPAGVTSLDSKVLDYCYSLQTLILPGTMTSICEEAFGGTYNRPIALTRVLFGGSEGDWQALCAVDRSGVLAEKEVYYCSFAASVPVAGMTEPAVAEAEGQRRVSVKTYLDPAYDGARLCFARYDSGGVLADVGLPAPEAGFGSYESPAFPGEGDCRLMLLTADFIPLCPPVTAGG